MKTEERKAPRRLGATLRLSLLALLTLSAASGAPRPALAGISGALQRHADHADTGGCPGKVAAQYGIRTTKNRSTAWAVDTMPAVAAFSADNAWVAGYASPAVYVRNLTPLNQTISLIEHWDGQRWCVAAHTEQHTGKFLGLAGVTAADIWAVGVLQTDSGPVFLEHWDGHAWSMVRLPAGPSYGNPRSLIAASSARNVWLYGLPNGSVSVVEHWDGQQWRSANAGLPPSTRDLWTALTTRSASDTWAATLSPNRDLLQPPAVLHWDGIRWRQMVLPPQADDRREVTIDALAPLSSSDVWAVGDYQVGSGLLSGGPIAFHWNGRTWSQVSVPNDPRAAGPGSDVPGWGLGAIAVLSPTNILAMGSGGTAHPVRWNGHAWVTPTAPLDAPTVRHRSISSISVASPANIWAAEFGPVQYGPLVVNHWDGHHWNALSLVPAG